MLSNFLFWIIPAIYALYLFVVIKVFEKIYVYKINDVRVILDRFLILGLFGILVTAMSFYFLLKKKLGMRKIVAVLVINAGILIGAYYLFVPTAVDMASWMDVYR